MVNGHDHWDRTVLGLGLGLGLGVRVRVRGVRSHTHILLTDPKHMSYKGQRLCSGEGITSTCRRVVKQPEANRRHAKHNTPLVVCQKTEPIIRGDIYQHWHLPL